MDKIQRLKDRIDYLEGTLKDTETVLFDPLISWALRHAMQVKKDLKQNYQTLLNNIQKLQAGKKKRPG